MSQNYEKSELWDTKLKWWQNQNYEKSKKITDIK